MLHFSNATKQYGSKILYKDAAFQLNAGEKVGLVGPNGSGKTTIFRVIAGEESLDSGQSSFPEKLVIGYFSQDIEEMKNSTVIDEVKSIFKGLPEIQKRMVVLELELAKELDEATMTAVLEEYGNIQTKFEALGGYDLDSRAAEILSGLGFPVEDQGQPVDHFSGGWKMRIELAKMLLLNPDLLLLDEPTNHLDLESIIWLEKWITEFKGSVFMTSHDREFMNRMVTKVVEVAHKTITTYSGDYDFYQREKVIRMQQLIASARRQEEMLAKERDFISRFAARASHAAQVQSRVKKLEKIEIIEIPKEERDIKFVWPQPVRGGDEVVKFTDLKKIWQKPGGDENLVFENANALVNRLDRVAIVGVNGAGKSTLMKIVSGETDASSGECKVGANIEFGYFSQNSLDVLDPSMTIFEELQSRIPNSSVGFIKNLLGAFKFSGDDADKKVSILSGGEKSRVVLATILARPVNLLVLDEPTNHLDITSREVLLDAIKEFPGTVMIVSHDRYFLRQVVTRVFELDRKNLRIYDGTWDEYLRRSEVFQ